MPRAGDIDDRRPRDSVLEDLDDGDTIGHGVDERGSASAGSSGQERPHHDRLSQSGVDRTSGQRLLRRSACRQFALNRRNRPAREDARVSTVGEDGDEGAELLRRLCDGEPDFSIRL